MFSWRMPGPPRRLASSRAMGARRPWPDFGPSNRPGARRGFVLLAVLWVTAMLAMFALNYSTQARLKGLFVQVSRDLAQDRLLLLSALELGRHEYLKYRINKDLLEDKDFMEWITGRSLGVLYPRHEPHRVEVDGHPALVAMIEQTGRLNVNGISQPLLERILAVCGAQPGLGTMMIVNGILDWQDHDDLHRMEGAESDYYLGLERPYFPKNGDLQSLEELLLIRGVTPKLYYGTPDHPGLVDFLGVSGDNTQIDINSASPRTFALLEGFPDEAAQTIVAMRREAPIRVAADLADIVPQPLMSGFMELFAIVPSPRVTIRAALLDADETPGRWMELTVDSEQWAVNRGQ